jgi:aminopeptidase N
MNQPAIRTRTLIHLLKPLFFLAVISFSITTTFAIRRERLIEAWQPRHYLVNITLNDQLTEIVSARAEIDVEVLKRLSVIDLDFGDLTTESVSLNSKQTSFEHRNGTLEINLPEPANAGARLTVTVTYHGKPKDGLILTTDKDGKPSAVGDNWPDRVHHWIPCLDHPSAKAAVTFKITAPVRDVVVANGRLDGIETEVNGDRTWTYTEGAPIPPYCMIIGVGEFVRLEPAQKTLIPLSYYVPHSDSSNAQKGFAPAAPALELFSRIVAPYPYQKLALIVGATRFGGMENSGAIVFTSTLFNPNPEAQVSRAFGISNGIEDVVAHEIAHQWFGDSVTESTWADLWLSEGFATYFAGLFRQRYEGEEAFQNYMKQAAETYFAYEKKNLTPIVDLETEDLFKLLNPNNYQKGAWVLHMLRSMLGDDAFFRGIRSYYSAHINSTATSNDLRVAFEMSSGINLRSFFDQWVYGSGHPIYRISSEWKKVGGSHTLKIKLLQIQNGDAFLIPVPIEVVTTNGTQRVTIRPNGKETIMRIPLATRPTAILIDPDQTILKEATD